MAHIGIDVSKNKLYRTRVQGLDAGKVKPKVFPNRQDQYPELLRWLERNTGETPKGLVLPGTRTRYSGRRRSNRTPRTLHRRAQHHRRNGRHLPGGDHHRTAEPCRLRSARLQLAEKGKAPAAG